MRIALVASVTLSTWALTWLLSNLGWNEAPTAIKGAVGAVAGIFVALTAIKSYEQVLVTTVAWSATGLVMAIGTMAMAAESAGTVVQVLGAAMFGLGLIGAKLAADETRALLKE